MDAVGSANLLGVVPVRRALRMEDVNALADGHVGHVSGHLGDDAGTVEPWHVGRSGLKKA